MPRVNDAPASRRRRKKFLKRASGYLGGRHRLYKIARQTVEGAGQNAYAGRKERKRDFRQLWIARINAAARAWGLSYSRFFRGLKMANVNLNRKMLAELAVSDAASFTQLAEVAKSKLESAS
jgi:large subunit ribosomal protein L20